MPLPPPEWEQEILLDIQRDYDRGYEAARAELRDLLIKVRYRTPDARLAAVICWAARSTAEMEVMSRGHCT